MTDRQGSLPVVTAFGAVFCVALIFLALQLRAGEDPAIGAGPEAAAVSSQPRPVIVRRVIVRRIVEDAPGEPAAPRATGGAAAPAPAPAASAPAPAASAPAPAAPAPAPAPAPVTTQAS